MNFEFVPFGPISISTTIIVGISWVLKIISIFKKWRDKSEETATSLHALAELAISIVSSGAIVAASMVTENSYNIVKESYQAYKEIENFQVQENVAVNDTRVKLLGQLGQINEDMGMLTEDMKNIKQRLLENSEHINALRIELIGQLDQVYEDMSNTYETTTDRTIATIKEDIALNTALLESVLDSSQNHTASLAEILRHIELLDQLPMVVPFSLLPKGTVFPQVFQIAGITFVIHEEKDSLGNFSVGSIDDSLGYMFPQEGLTIFIPTIGVERIDLTVCIGGGPVTGEALDESGATLNVYETPSQRGCHIIQFESPDISAVRLMGGNNEAMITQVLAGGAE